MRTYRFITILLFSCLVMALHAQPVERMVRVSVSPNHTDWLYEEGEKVSFQVEVLRCNVPVQDMEVRYELSEDMMKAHKTGTVSLKDGKARIDAGTLKKAGFLRCRVLAKYGEREYEGLATVGFSPEKLQPVTKLPDDFLDFWKANREVALKWDLEPLLTLMPEKCTDKVNVYHISFQNNDYTSRMYGILCVPKAPGKYPAILKLPGAGVYAHRGEMDRASKGFIILELGIHGIPLNMQGSVYTNLYRGALKNYHSFNLDDRNTYYYKRVYMGCVKAIDFIYTLPEFNGNLATFGGSQGGALSMVTAALDSRVKGLVAYYPALCDVAGYAHGRAGGWPHTFKTAENRTPVRLETMQYYDVVNFARQIKVPGFYTFGYNDMVCPPTTTYSAYNVIQAPKELMVAETTAHYAYIEQSSAAWKWVMDFLRNCNE